MKEFLRETPFCVAIAVIGHILAADILNGGTSPMAKKPQKFTQSEVERLIRAAVAQGLVVDGIVADANGIRLSVSRG